MANDQVRAISERYWSRFLELEPITGTFFGFEEYDDRLPDPSEEGRAAEEALASETIAALAQLDRETLDDNGRIEADLLEVACARSLSSLSHRLDRLAAANQMFGPTTMLGEIATLQQVGTPEQLERYVTRLRAFPAYLEGWAEVARDGIRSGVVSPRVVAERAVAQLERILATPLDSSPAMMPVAEVPEAKDRIEDVVRDHVNPALQTYVEVLRREYLPVSADPIGLSSLPGGDGMYAAEVLGWTTLPLDPGAVHELGLERLEGIERERHAIAVSLGYASAAEAVADRTAKGENTAGSAEELVSIVEDQVRRSWDAAPAFFGRLPHDNCRVRPVEPFREQDSPLAFYNPPTEDGSRPGTYYINTYALDDRALHHLASVTFHEANPGHHFQISLEQEVPDRSDLRRFGSFLGGSAYAEGWGLYAERLADEMGLYLDDWERLGMLESQGHRAARLVTDTGIHALGWTREQAIDLLERSGQTHTDAVIEVDRYIAMPAQALCYMVGMIEIERARAATERREDADFSLQAFHDRVLGLGWLPLPAFRHAFGTSSS
jgi:uncharacterized protein (DUF885 family)